MVERLDYACSVSQLRPAGVQDVVVPQILDVPGIEALRPERFLAGDDLDAPSWSGEEGFFALGTRGDQLFDLTGCFLRKSLLCLRRKPDVAAGLVDRPNEEFI